MDQPILSICIPAYNRCECLDELLKIALSIDRQDIEVVVTDNVSTDGTAAMLASISDSRLKVYKNQETLPAFCNMVNAIYNAKGKYALYCNDRDLLVPERIIQLIDVLYANDYSFVYLTRVKANNKQELYVYEKGLESIERHPLVYHPTGMVYNRNIIAKENLEKKTYYSYLAADYTWCFLMRDLFRYEKSACYDCGGWKEREQKFKLTHRAGTLTGKEKQPFFCPERRVNYTLAIVKQVVQNNIYSLTDSELDDLTYLVLSRGMRMLFYMKWYYASPNEAAHYGLKRRIISTRQMIRYYIASYKSVYAFLLENHFSSSMLEKWEKYYYRGLLGNVEDSLSVYLRLIKHFALDALS